MIASVALKNLTMGNEDAAALTPIYTRDRRGCRSFARLLSWSLVGTRERERDVWAWYKQNHYKTL